MTIKFEDRLKVFLDMVVDMYNNNKAIDSCYFEVGIDKTEFEVYCSLRKLGCRCLGDEFRYGEVYFYLDKDEDNFIEIIVKDLK